VTWQDPTPAYPPQFGAPPQGPTPQQPGQGPTASAAVRWVAAAGVVALLLVGAVVLHRTVLSHIFGGAASPVEAVNQLVAAARNKDLKGLGLLLPPDEVAGFGDIQNQLKRISSDLGEQTNVSPDALTNGVEVSIDNLKLKTHDEQRGLTKVSIENADITASFDPSQVPEAMKKYFENRDTSKQTATITVRGADVTVNGRESTITLHDREQSPFVMTVERNGSWYVSPLFTYFQYASESYGLHTSPIDKSSGFDSPVAAAQGWVSALAKTANDRDITAVARATGGVEGLLMQTYRELINKQFGRGAEFSVTVQDSQFRELSVSGDTARVQPETLKLSATSDGQASDFDWDGNCVKIHESESHRHYCLGEKSVGPFTPLIQRLEYLVAVRSDDGWKLSASRTVFSWISDVLSWVGNAEMPILKAITHGDPTELTKSVKSAGTVQLGNSTTIHIESIGPYVDGGYAIVDIPDPSGEAFEAYCHSSTSGCSIVTLVTPSGKTEDSYNGGGNGEEGTYKAILVAGAGRAEVRAEVQ
jgi:hypothetical protein